MAVTRKDRWLLPGPRMCPRGPSAWSLSRLESLLGTQQQQADPTVLGAVPLSHWEPLHPALFLSTQRPHPDGNTCGWRGPAPSPSPLGGAPLTRPYPFLRLRSGEPLPLAGTPALAGRVKGSELAWGACSSSLLSSRPCLPTLVPVLSNRRWYGLGGSGTWGPQRPASDDAAAPVHLHSGMPEVCGLSLFCFGHLCR